MFIPVHSRFLKILSNYVMKLKTQIDQLVYKLYNLTEEEIAIMEG